LRNRPGDPMYYDSVFSRIENYINECEFLAKHKRCDGCQSLVRCRHEWDMVCERFEDQELPQEMAELIIEKILACCSF